MVRLSPFALAVVAALLCTANVPTVALSETSPDGAWSTVTGPPGRSDHVTIYDPVHDRILLFGGDDGMQRGQDVWELDASRTWRRLLPADLEVTVFSNRPYGCGHAAIYDPLRPRMLMFGGKTSDVFRSEVWVLDLEGPLAWSLLPVQGTPPPGRTDHTAIYDSDRDAMIVFGGTRNDRVFDDVWMLSLSGTPTWSRIVVEGASLPRHRHVAVYDPVGERMIVHGGTDGIAAQGTWALPLTGTPQWTAIDATGGPTQRIRQAATFDARRSRMIVFGGTDGTRRNDVWALSLNSAPAWSGILPSGARPSRRNDATITYDGVHDALVLFGGYENPTRRPSDCWELPLGGASRWRMLTPSFGQPPLQAYYGSAAYDPRRDRLIQFGGWFESLHNELHALSLSGDRSWSKLQPLGAPPPPTSFAAPVYDPVRDRMLFFGGTVSDGYWTRWNSNDTWELSLSGAPTWKKLEPVGERPVPCGFASAVYDPLRDRILVFGGSAWPLHPNDTWALSLSGTPTWTRIETAGTKPTNRYRHFAMYDALRDRMLIFAGQRDVPGLDASPREIWALSLSGTPTWSEITPAVSPFHSGASQATIYDPVRDRLVAFAPWGPTGNDAWALELSGRYEWRRLEPELTPPFFQQPAIYDPVRDRLIAYGNAGTEPPWALTFGQPLAPEISSDPAIRWTGSSMQLDARFANPIDGERMIEWRIEAEPSLPGLPMQGLARVAARGVATVPVAIAIPDALPAGLVALRLSAAYYGAAGNESRHEVAVPIVSTTSFALHDVRPNPAIGEMAAFFSLPAAGRATLEVFDVSGRRVGVTQEMELPAGRHRIAITPGVKLAPGVHFVRLGFGGQTVESRVVVVS